MLYLTHKVKTMLGYAVEQAEGKEVGGLGKTFLFPNGAGVLVQDILIPKQVVTTGTTKIEASTMAWIVEELARRREDGRDWRCWWHVHPFSSTKPSPSSTDTDTLDSLAEELGWAVGLIIPGKEGPYYGWMALLEPWPLTIECDVKIASQDFPRLRSKVSEMMANVTHEAPIVVHPGKRKSGAIQSVKDWVEAGGRAEDAAYLGLDCHGNKAAAGQYLPGHVDLVEGDDWPAGLGMGYSGEDGP